MHISVFVHTHSLSHEFIHSFMNLDPGLSEKIAATVSKGLFDPVHLFLCLYRRYNGWHRDAHSLRAWALRSDTVRVFCSSSVRIISDWVNV